MVFRALSHRNYRLFFGGQSISLIGTWLQITAVSWLVFRLTGSSFLLGVVGFTSRIPTFLLASFAGVLVDRWNRHRLLVATQVFSLIQALILAVLVLTDAIAFWHIIVLTLFLGVVNAFDVPVRQSFVVDMIERREDLGNAIALNSSMVNGARLVGPSVAGTLIATMGEGLCFLLNALSFVAVIVSLLAMRITPKTRERNKAPLWYGLTERIPLCLRILSYPVPAPSACACQLHGNALYRPHACLCRKDPSGRTANPRFSARGYGRRSFGRRPVSWPREGVSSAWAASSSLLRPSSESG